MFNARFRSLLILIVIFASAALVWRGCASSSSAPKESLFDTPQSAVDSLIAALRVHDHDKLVKIFGPDGDQILSSGDAVADQQDANRFVAAYDARHNLQTDANGKTTLVVGDQDWPFPVPIVASDGKFIFDTAAGEDEILNRRIGRNELSAEEVCLAIVDAQRDYVRLRPMGGDLPLYARKIMSTPGQHDGLYWPTPEGDPPSPLGELVAGASAEGYTAKHDANDQPPPYHGYRYRLLTRQGPNATGGALDYEVNGQLIGGFAVVAYPAEYGNSGIMTFITNHDGVVYQKDLGTDTASLASQMTSFDPDSSWKRTTDASQPDLTTQPTAVTQPTQ